MSFFRFLFVLIVLVFYGLLFTEQRIESREKQRQTVKITQELEQLNGRKQELTVLIEKERNRLVRQSKNMGTSLSPKDVVILD